MIQLAEIVLLQVKNIAEIDIVDSNFDRHVVSYNEFLTEYNLDEIDADGYWDVHYQWSLDEAEDGYTSGSPFDGYTSGMTLEQYKTVVEDNYTTALNRTMTWSLDGNEITITDEGEESSYTQM